MRPFFERAKTMLEINLLVQSLKDIQARTDVLRGYL
jgi:hypothetical protein